MPRLSCPSSLLGLPAAAGAATSAGAVSTGATLTVSVATGDDIDMVDLGDGMFELDLTDVYNLYSGDSVTLELDGLNFIDPDNDADGAPTQFDFDFVGADPRAAASFGGAAEPGVFEVPVCVCSQARCHAYLPNFKGHPDTEISFLSFLSSDTDEVRHALCPRRGSSTFDAPPLRLLKRKEHMLTGHWPAL